MSKRSRVGELAASSAEESSVAGGILSLWPLKGEGKWLQQVQGILKTGNRKEVRMEEAVAQGRCLFLAPKGTLSRMISICDFPDLSCFGNQCVTEGGPVAAKFQVSEFVQRHQEKGLPMSKFDIPRNLLEFTDVKSVNRMCPCCWGIIIFFLKGILYFF